MSRWVLGITAVAALAAPAAAQDDAKKIVEKALAAHGGADTLKKYKASKATLAGDMALAGMTLTFTGTTANEFPGKWRMTFESSIMGQKLEVFQVADGDKIKQKITVGTMDVSPADGQKDEIRQTAIVQDMSLIFPLLDEKRFSLKAEPDGDVDGKKVAVVTVTILDNSRTVTLSFDKESGLLVKAKRKGQGAGADGSMKEVDEESFMSDYKKVNGVMVAHKLVVHQDGTKFMTCTMSDVEVLESLPNDTFKTDD
jgi:hypothetical protein